MKARRWWHGPLDAEGLARRAVAAAKDSAQHLADVRDQNPTVGTSDRLIAGSFAAIDHLRIDGRAATGWAEMSGFFRAKDGWVRTHANYPHHAAALSRAFRASTRQELERALEAHTAQDIETQVSAAGGIAVKVRSADEWRAHPQAKQARMRPGPRLAIAVPARRSALPPCP